MPTVYKVLGQSNPSAGGTATLCTATVSTVVSTITVCNQGGTAGTYSVAVRPAGASLATVHYIAFNASLPANSTDTLTLGITLAATDVITVGASSANFSFSAFGSEIS